MDMANSGDKRKAVAKCTDCDAISPVTVWPDGTVHPLGRSEICDCRGADLEILDTEGSAVDA